MQQKQLKLPGGVTVRDPAGESYTIEGLLGTGGFGAVYLVRDRHARQNLYALKEIIDPEKEDREHFLFEGEILKRLQHPALPRVYRAFENDKLKRVYLLMDYIKGKNLDALQIEQPDRRFSLPLVLAIMAPVVDALIYLHNQNPPIVHRDIKPANIILPINAESTILVDFGAAKEYVADKTTSIIRQGSHGYAPLEQYKGGTTPRTDIYGLGATLYTLLTGVVPIDVISRASASGASDPLKPVNQLVPAISSRVSRAIQRALSISSTDRFESVEEFWQELTSDSPDSKVDIPRVTSFDPPRPLTPSHPRVIYTSNPRRIRPLLAIIAAPLLIAAFSIGLVLYYAQHSGSPTRVASPTHIASPTATATSIPTISNYPMLTVAYAGTVGDLLAKTETAMYLTNIQQNQGDIQGSFQGLGLTGSFKGTVTSSGHIQFTVIVYGGGASLLFDGDIKIGGDIVGTYKTYDKNGNATGDYGVWNVASHS